MKNKTLFAFAILLAATGLTVAQNSVPSAPHPAIQQSVRILPNPQAGISITIKLTATENTALEAVRVNTPGKPIIDADGNASPSLLYANTEELFNVLLHGPGGFMPSITSRWLPPAQRAQ